MTINEKLREIEEKFDKEFVLRPFEKDGDWSWSQKATPWDIKAFISTSSHELLEICAKEIERLEIDTMIERNAGLTSAANLLRESIK